MLQLKNIVKTYAIADMRQHALKGVSVSFRDNEFVSILGQSGSGKTTMLNIIGGLDRYTSGDLIINGVSTKEYGDSEWDIYRNHSVGFIFQSYNLIPHQSVLSNVEMALTLAGISKKERRERALEVLKKVGLEAHINKKPNQMSGGQMQRVAIARALINNPDILLADEPTGALDSETSIQIMELLKEIAKDKLVIMVTHNPELAEQYSTRIVRLLDGKIISDSDPYEENIQLQKPKKQKRISMSFFTALALSFNNLKTKKGRTLLTSMAGSIGIIGIGLVLAISTGMTEYINSIQRDTMSSYPITINSQAIDNSAFYTQGNTMTGDMGEQQNVSAQDEDDAVRVGIYSDFSTLQTGSMLSTVIKDNNLRDFKKYLDSPDSSIHQYLRENGIEYGYDIKYSVYTRNPDGKLMDSNDDPKLDSEASYGSTGSGSIIDAIISGSTSFFSGMNSATAENFNEIPKGIGGEMINPQLHENYNLLYGNWPKDKNEIILVLDSKNSIAIEDMFQLGFITNEQYNEVAKKIKNTEEAQPIIFDYATICQHSFYLVTLGDHYIDSGDGTFHRIENIDTNEEKLLENALEIKISGVVQRKKDVDGAYLSGPIAYTNALKNYIIEKSSASAVVKAQFASPEINVINGMKFEIPDESEKITATKQYLSSLSENEKASIYRMISLLNITNVSGSVGEATNPQEETTTVPPTTVAPEAPAEPETEHNQGILGGVFSFVGDIFDNIGKTFEDIRSLFEILSFINNLSEQYPELSGGNIEDISSMLQQFQNIQSGNFEDINMSGIDIESILNKYLGEGMGSLSSNDAYFAEMLDKWLEDSPDEKILLTVYDQYITESTYDENLENFGYVDFDTPSTINLYADNFENKDGIALSIEEYNKSVDKESTISYTDYVAMITSSLTSIINGVSYVLVAFVAISLFVSCIMIGIITHISVMERTKEIGILRALGASKANISQVFNAETFIIGCCSGILGIAVSLLCLIPINSIIEAKTGIENLDAQLPLVSSLVLIVISIAITIICGLIPSVKAAKKDPVEALRTE